MCKETNNLQYYLDYITEWAKINKINPRTAKIEGIGKSYTDKDGWCHTIFITSEFGSKLDIRMPWL